MLSIKKFITSTKFNISYNKIYWKCQPIIANDLPYPYQRANYSRIMIACEEIDPEVRKLQDKIIHSDYLERKHRHLPMDKMIELQRYIKFQERKDKIQEHISTPINSISLKYLNAASILENDKYTSNLEPEEKESPSGDSKPIYMPYAAHDNAAISETDINEDQIENEDESMVESQEEQEEEEEESLNSLDDISKLRYEEFLDKKREEMKTKWRDDINRVPDFWMADYPVFDESKLKSDGNKDPWLMKYGTPEPNSKITSIPCGGCGALLHCKDPEIPGYIPSELFTYKKEKELNSFICQRCHFMKYYKVALDVKVTPDDYPALLSKIKGDHVKAVVLLIDLLDFPCCIWPNLPEIIGKKTPVILVGNKVDLLPQDCSKFFKNLKTSIFNAAVDSGINPKNILETVLVSAKSHYGIEEFINKLFQNRRKGNVYLVGCTNVGKSSLFNALIQSDYCKSAARDLIQRATVAPWPGTTLNLLKFPVKRGSSEFFTKRIRRLISEQEEKYLEREYKRIAYIQSRKIRFATLQGHIGLTSRQPVSNVSRENKVMDIFHMDKKDDLMEDEKRFGLDENSPLFRFGNWCFDTPGTIQPEQILHLLTTEELLNTLPRNMIKPRTFIMKANQTLFLAGLGRIDILESYGLFRTTVFASDALPVTICETQYADDLYKELIKTDAFVVPVKDEERLKIWPELKSKEFEVVGIDTNFSVADVVLSSGGWVSITPSRDVKVRLAAWTPEGRGIYLRQPALLGKSVALRGIRVQNTPTYYKPRVYFSNEN